MLLDELLGRLGGVKSSGDGYVAKCPAHDDHRQSLSLGVGDDGRVLVNCHAGCAPDAVCEALGITLADLFAEEPSGNGKREIVATYDYVDERGELLYQVVRFTPKDFRQRRPDGAGGWTWKVAGTRRVLYRLQQVLFTAAIGGTVYVVEGEKDVHALEAAGVVATTSPAGAGKWRPEYSEALTGAHVVVVADRDDPGRQHALQVAASLEGKAQSVRILEAAVGKDAADHLAAGKTVQELVVPTWAQPGERADSPFVDWSTFWEEDDTQDEWAYPNVLAKGRGHAIYAMHKGGKSLLALYMVAEMVTRHDAACLYLDYEMTAQDVRERLRDMGHGPETDLSHLYYALLPTLPPLDTEAGAAELMAMVDGILAHDERHLVVVIDTISRAIVGEENSADTWRLFYVHTGLRLKQRGTTWLRLDHGGKDATKGQRGSSGKGDDVDVVWKLQPTENGVVLRRELARMSWVPEQVALLRQDFPLRYLRAAHDYPAGTAEVANILDRLNVPIDASVRTAGTALRSIDEGRRHDVVSAALKFRIERGEHSGERGEHSPGTKPGTAGNKGGSSLGNTPGNAGEQLPGMMGNAGSSLKRGPASHAADPSEREES